MFNIAILGCGVVGSGVADILFDISIFGRGENNGKRNFPSVPQGPFIDQKVEITDKK